MCVCVCVCVCVYTPTPNKVRSDDFPGKAQTLEFPKDLCHDILRSALGANAQVPLGSLHCPQGLNMLRVRLVPTCGELYK